MILKNGKPNITFYYKISACRFFYVYIIVLYSVYIVFMSVLKLFFIFLLSLNLPSFLINCKMTSMFKKIHSFVAFITPSQNLHSKRHNHFFKWKVVNRNHYIFYFVLIHFMESSLFLSLFVHGSIIFMEKDLRDNPFMFLTYL
jgi:hypothetical protein